MRNVALSLICNAPTAATRNAAFPDDEPLDSVGQSTAAAAASSVRRVDAAWSSPARRAMQTAEALGLAAEPEPLLRDIDYGRWAGRSLDEVAATDPVGVSAWRTDPAAAPHGGETVAELFGRVATWLDVAAGWDGRVVAVTHAAVMRAAIGSILGADPASFWRIDIGPLCRVRLRGQAGVWTLLSVGR